MDKYTETAKDYCDAFRRAKSDDEKELILLQLADEDLAVLEALLKTSTLAQG